MHKLCSCVLSFFNPDFFPPIDPDHPFIERNDKGTVFITASDTNIEVPCLVSDPELNVTLFSVGMAPCYTD